jgi:uncharacterized protein
MLRELLDPAEFSEAAAPLLLSDVGRYNLMLGIAHTLVTAPERYPEWRLWVVEDGGDVVGAALRTPPFHLLVAGAAEPLAATGLDIPGVNGAEPEVHLFAAAWAQATGGTPSVGLRMGIHRLDRVEDVPVPSGGIRRAAEGDRELLTGWMLDFTEEAGLQGGEEHARESIGAKLGNGDDLVVWEDGGRVVSMSGSSFAPPGCARIGPVYTPPDLRGRGYATALVAELTRRLMAAGRSPCFLYTDLANPTSNAIYRRIGYRQIGTAAEVALRLPVS